MNGSLVEQSVMTENTKLGQDQNVEPLERP